jgi:quercetin dioxygenase-like cupin family protein
MFLSNVFPGFARYEMPSLSTWITGLCVIALPGTALTQEWVPVYEEPKHRPVFENDQVLILDVNLPPGYVSLYHEHRLDTLYVTLSGTQVYAQPLGGEKRHADVKTGDLRFSSDNHELPHIHRVGNVGRAPFHIIGVGIKTEGSNTIEPVEGDMQAMELVDEKSHASVYRIRLDPGEKSGVHQHKLPFTRVYLSGGKLGSETGEPTAFEAGEFLWQGGGVSHRYENAGEEPIEIVEVQAR